MQTPTETTCQHCAWTFKLRRGVRSSMGLPFLACLQLIHPPINRARVHDSKVQR